MKKPGSAGVEQCATPPSGRERAHTPDACTARHIYTFGRYIHGYPHRHRSRLLRAARSRGGRSAGRAPLTARPPGSRRRAVPLGACTRTSPPRTQSASLLRHTHSAQRARKPRTRHIGSRDRQHASHDGRRTRRSNARAAAAASPLFPPRSSITLPPPHRHTHRLTTIHVPRAPCLLRGRPSSSPGVSRARDDPWPCAGPLRFHRR